MKYIIILGDGMADRPIAALGGKTPLMVAHTPHIDRLTTMAKTGTLVTVPADMPPGSEVANMAVLGYDVKAVYQGRGVLEAASMGVALQATDLAMRCNLICVEEQKIKNHSAGHISTEEAAQLVAMLNETLGSESVQFYPGVSYRHLLVIKNGQNEIALTPPHDVPGTPFSNVMPQATAPSGEETAALLKKLILKSQTLLEGHPVNRRRRDRGKDMATSIWPWAAGYKPEMKTLHAQYGVTGAVISAVDLIHGIGVYAGMKVMHVQGATGLYDTHYEGKVQAAIEALDAVDLVYLHIEASDEAGHEGDVDLKIQTIEALDQRVVKPLLAEAERRAGGLTLALLPDHPTPCELRTHVRDAVPFLIARPGVVPDAVMHYDETHVQAGAFGQLQGTAFMKALLNQNG